MIKGPMIGEGAEKRVYEIPNSPDKLNIELKRPVSKEMVKAYYYLWKIGHLLFPENLPDVHLASRKQDASLLVQKFKRTEEEEQMVRANTQRKYGDGTATAEETNLWQQFRGRVDRDPEWKKIFTAFRESGLPIFDLNHGNLGYGPDGKQLFFDLSEPWMENAWGKNMMTRYDIDQLHAAIQRLPEPEKRRAEFYFKRLTALTPKEKN